MDFTLDENFALIGVHLTSWWTAYR